MSGFDFFWKLLIDEEATEITEADDIWKNA